MEGVYINFPLTATDTLGEETEQKAGEAVAGKPEGGWADADHGEN